MKNLKLKLTIIGISLLSTNIFAQDYIYKGVKKVKANIGINKEEIGSGQEAISDDCYDPENIGKIGTAKGCSGLLIVDNEILRNLVLENAYTTGNKTIPSYADTVIFTGQVTNIDLLFCNFPYSNIEGCTFKKPTYSISNWNTENITSMDKTFLYLEGFNQNLSNWDVGNVINMESMFSGTDIFNQNLNEWDVSKVTNMYGLFYNSNFNQSLNNWCVSLIPSKPNNFDRDSGFEGESEIFNPNGGVVHKKA